MLFDLEEIIKKYDLQITGVLHIGAHKCEEKEIYNKLNIKRIIWIEANPYLCNNNIYNFAAINSDIGYSTLHITNKTDSSTIFDFCTHSKYYPDIFVEKNVKVKNKTIDTFYLEEKINKDYANTLVLCIQGSELLCLKGMKKSLKNFNAIFMKVNSDFVYVNCPLIHEVENYIKNYNFYIKETIWTNKDWGWAFFQKINSSLPAISEKSYYKSVHPPIPSHSLSSAPHPI